MAGAGGGGLSWENRVRRRIFVAKEKVQETENYIMRNFVISPPPNIIHSYSLLVSPSSRERSILFKYAVNC
jgi:hypothetical protein